MSEQLPPGIELDYEVAKRIYPTFETHLLTAATWPDVYPHVRHTIPEYSYDGIESLYIEHRPKESSSHYWPSRFIGDAQRIAEDHRLALIPLSDGRWFCGQRSKSDWYLNEDTGIVDGHLNNPVVGITISHAISLWVVKNVAVK